MPNELFNLLNGNNGRPQQPRQAPARQPMNMNSPLAMLREFGKFKRDMVGKNPEQIVKGLLQSGQMSQQEFQQFRQMANDLKDFLR